MKRPPVKTHAEKDVTTTWRKVLTYLQRPGVTSRIKRQIRRRERREANPELPPTGCRLYWCPTAGEYECCGEHCGFDVCCDAPEKHVHLTPATVVTEPPTREG